MTGLSDDDHPADGRPDPLDALLRPAVSFLPVPPGSFERIRRTAARRRRVKAATAGGLTVAVVAGSLYLGGVFRPPGDTVVVTPPASSGRLEPGPSESRSASPRPSRSTAPASPSAGPSSSAAEGTGTKAAGRGGTSAASSARASASTPMCATSQLTASLGGGNSGAGNVYRYLLLTNVSGTTCHLTGYPGLSMLDADGKQIGAPATKDSFGYVPVVLAPGATASDTVHTANRQTSSSTECLATSVKLRVYPPGNRDPLIFPSQIANCDNTFSVSPLTAGSTGNPPN